MDSEKICLTTLAIGSKYRNLASLLAQDLIKLEVDNPFIILTDQPQDFTKFKNVIPIKHSIRSVSIYHDKRFCFEESLKQFDCCIFLDADCRLFKNIIISRPWKKGLTVKSCQSLMKHITRGTQKPNKAVKFNHQHQLALKISNKYSINLEECKFINEILFILRKDKLKHEKFLQTWDEIRILFEANRIFDGEGVIMGLAAHIANLNIYHYDTGYMEVPELHRINDVYKDKLFLNSKNISVDIKEHYLQFELQRKTIEKEEFVISSKLIKILQTIKREQRFKKLQTDYNLIYS